MEVVTEGATLDCTSSECRLQETVHNKHYYYYLYHHHHYYNIRGEKHLIIFSEFHNSPFKCETTRSSELSELILNVFGQQRNIYILDKALIVLLTAPGSPRTSIPMERVLNHLK